MMAASTRGERIAVASVVTQLGGLFGSVADI